jgi:cysteine desulfurase
MIYLDYAASTPCDKRVVEAMLPFFDKVFSNPSNITNDLGIRSSKAVETARDTIAGCLNCTPDKIIWTSGATESNNLAILGSVIKHRINNPTSVCHIITSSIEHKSVLSAATAARSLYGCELTIIEPSADGSIDPNAIRNAVRENTVLVSLMMANNEIGSINDIFSIGNLCNEKGITFHSDATQFFAKLPIDLRKCPVDLLSFSGHKFYGPKGVGGLFVRDISLVSPLQYGGGQESGLRSGTLNVPAIVGIAKACELSHIAMPNEIAQIQHMRDLLERNLKSIHSVTINGKEISRLPNIASVTFDVPPGVNMMNLITEGRKIACSSGAACDSDDVMPSHVMMAIGKTRHQAKNTLRFSLGRFTSEDDINHCVEHLQLILKKRVV